MPRFRGIVVSVCAMQSGLIPRLNGMLNCKKYGLAKLTMIF